MALGLLVKQDHRYANTLLPVSLWIVTSRLCGYCRSSMPTAGVWGQLNRSVAVLPGQDTLFSQIRSARSSCCVAYTLTRFAGSGPGCRLDLRQRRRLLDLGGGAGTYTIAFCQASPELTAVLFDLPGPLALAQTVVSAAGLTDRVTLVAGDFHTDALPRGFDLVLLSNILHGRSEEINQHILREVYRVLEPAGELIVRDVLMNDDRTSPTFGALFAVNLLLHSASGRCYTFSEFSGWLTKIGFRDLEVLETNAVVRARK